MCLQRRLQAPPVGEWPPQHPCSALKTHPALTVRQELGSASKPPLSSFSGPPPAFDECDAAWGPLWSWCLSKLARRWLHGKAGFLLAPPKPSARLQTSAICCEHASQPADHAGGVVHEAQQACSSRGLACPQRLCSRPCSTMQGRLCRGEATGSHAGCWADVRAAAKATGGGRVPPGSKSSCGPARAHAGACLPQAGARGAAEAAGETAARWQCRQASSSVSGIAGAAEAQLIVA